MKSFKPLLFLFLSLINFVHAQKINVYNRPLQSERSRKYDAIHYRIKLRFDEEKKTFWGENTITLSPFKDGFKTCVLDAETFTVNSVVNENFLPLKFEQEDHKLIVHLSKSYNYEDTITFTVSYVSENVQGDPKKFGMSENYAIGLSFVDESPANPRLIQALSFPVGARFWFPCYDHPNDKATQETIITVKSQYKALSNGKLISVTEDVKNKTKTFHWSQELPHPTYLSVLVAGPYEVIKDSLGSLPINYWVYKKDVKDAKRSFHKTPKIIEFFNKEFGFEYPWAKYDQITIPGIGGGAECTSATLLGQGTIHDEKAEQDFPSHWLVAHEAAHQWWGDLVTLRDWGHTWINESFATYSDYLFAKYDMGEEEGEVYLLNKKNQYLHEAHTRYMRPIVFHRWNYPNENFDSHTYPKGAVVLHMMRWILGEKPFLKTLSHFLKKHAFKPADTNDFLTAVKEATGQNLDWFFDQWLYKPGHPLFEVSYSWDKSTKKLKLKIVQTQDTSKLVPIFKTPIVIGIITQDENKSEKIWLEDKEEVFEFECIQKPLLVRFDKGNYLLKEWTFNKSLDELIYQVNHDDVTGRMWAATELIKYDNPTVIESLSETAKNDQFWAVRRSAVETLGKIHNKEYITLLKEICEERNSKVRISALKALGGYQDTDLIEFFKDRFEKDDSYLAQAEALKALGEYQNKSLIPFFKEALKMSSPRNVIKRAAEWSLKQIREE